MLLLHPRDLLLVLTETPRDQAMNAALEACSGALMSHNTYKDIVKNKGNIDYWYDLRTSLCDDDSEEPAKHCMLVTVAIGLTTALCIGDFCQAIVHTPPHATHTERHWRFWVAHQ